jgi:hypothetical protein
MGGQEEGCTQIHKESLNPGLPIGDPCPSLFQRTRQGAPVRQRRGFCPRPPNLVQLVPHSDSACWRDRVYQIGTFLTLYSCFSAYRRCRYGSLSGEFGKGWPTEFAELGNAALQCCFETPRGAPLGQRQGSCPAHVSEGSADAF